MYQKTHKGQGIIWVILILAIIALIIVWISKNPQTSLTTTAPADKVVEPTPTATTTITPSQSLTDIKKSLDSLNSSASDIDKGINDTQLDVLN